MTQAQVREQILDLLEEGRIAEAGERLLDFQETHEDEVETWLLTATFFMMQGMAPQAEEALLVGYNLAPETYDVLYLLAHLYEEVGRPELAAPWMEKARRAAAAAHPSPALPQRAASAPAPRKPRLAVFVQEGLDQFLDDLLRPLGAHYEVRREVVSDAAQIEPAMAWADLCWFEWCNEVMVHASQLPLAAQKPVVCRLHRYEAFTDMPARVKWEHVDRLLLVAPHLQPILSSTVPGIEERVRMQILRNGVNLDRYAFRERRPGHRLAYVGYLHQRKNPTLLLQVMARLVRVDPRYQLFLAGEFQDPLLQLYWQHQRRALGLEGHVHFQGWQRDVAAWLGDKDYLLSTSLHESFGYSIAEAMAMGIKPVVHNFLCAGETWPEEVLFDEVEQAVSMVTAPEYDSAAYRAFIEEHYALDRQVDEVLAVLEEVRQASNAPTGHAEIRPHPFAPGALEGLVERVRAVAG